MKLIFLGVFDEVNEILLRQGNRVSWELLVYSLRHQKVERLLILRAVDFNAKNVSSNPAEQQTRFLKNREKSVLLGHQMYRIILVFSLKKERDHCITDGVIIKHEAEKIILVLLH